MQINTLLCFQLFVDISVKNFDLVPIYFYSLLGVASISSFQTKLALESLPDIGTLFMIEE